MQGNARSTQAQTPQQNIDPALIRSLIDNDVCNTAELKAILEQEKQALEKRDSDALQQILGRKQQVLGLLEQNNEARIKVLQAVGLSQNTQGWQQLIAHCKLEEPWRTLEENLKRCQELNAVNELVVIRSKQSVGHVLNILRGTLGQPNLYNESGVSGAHNSTGRTITTA